MGQPDRDKAAWLLSVAGGGEVFTCKWCGDLYVFPNESTQMELATYRVKESDPGTLLLCGPCANRLDERRGFACRIHFQGPNPWPSGKGYR